MARAVAQASSCTSPEVAVCIVGQLRTGARPRARQRIRDAWRNVGRSCIDIYLSLGIEEVVATNNGA